VTTTETKKTKKTKELSPSEEVMSMIAAGTAQKMSSALIESLGGPKDPEYISVQQWVDSMNEALKEMYCKRNGFAMKTGPGRPLKPRKLCIDLGLVPKTTSRSVTSPAGSARVPRLPKPRANAKAGTPFASAAEGVGRRPLIESKYGANVLLNDADDGDSKGTVKATGVKRKRVSLNLLPFEAMSLEELATHAEEFALHLKNYSTPKRLTGILRIFYDALSPVPHSAASAAVASAAEPVEAAEPSEPAKAAAQEVKEESSPPSASRVTVAATALALGQLIGEMSSPSSPDEDEDADGVPSDPFADPAPAAAPVVVPDVVMAPAPPAVAAAAPAVIAAPVVADPVPAVVAAAAAPVPPVLPPLAAVVPPVVVPPAVVPVVAAAVLPPVAPVAPVVVAAAPAVPTVPPAAVPGPSDSAPMQIDSSDTGAGADQIFAPTTPSVPQVSEVAAAAAPESRKRRAKGISSRELMGLQTALRPGDFPTEARSKRPRTK
jgi:hypothetical protein